LLVQRRSNKAAAVKLMRKLLKKQGFAPEVLPDDENSEVAQILQTVQKLGLSGFLRP
jgi:hypothetical protein